MRLPELQCQVTTCVCYRKTGRWLINYHSRNPKFEQFFPPARREGNSFLSPELKNLHPEVYCYDVSSVFWLRPIFKTYHEPVWPDVRNFAIRAKTLPWVIFLVQFICFWAKFMSIHLVTLAHDRNSPHGWTCSGLCFESFYLILGTDSLVWLNPFRSSQWLASHRCECTYMWDSRSASTADTG